MDGKTLTFCVSGLLWNRSLVMMDTETESLWSHILGLGVQGEHEGAQLEMLPAEMVTWERWRESYPHTTVLDLSHTHRDYTSAFYRDPAEFVFGWMLGGQAYSCSFKVLHEQPVLNLTPGGRAQVVTFDPESTSVHIFSRKVEGEAVRFVAEAGDRMRDEQSDSLWNRNTGMGLEGPMKGKQLEHDVGIVSYAQAWQVFHPDSKTVSGE